MFKTYMDFWLKSFKSGITYFPVDGFALADKPTADQIVNNVISKLYENKLFGSDWPVYPNRIYPIFAA